MVEVQESYYGSHFFLKKNPMTWWCQEWAVRIYEKADPKSELSLASLLAFMANPIQRQCDLSNKPHLSRGGGQLAILTNSQRGGGINFLEPWIRPSHALALHLEVNPGLEACREGQYILTALPVLS